jgi:hypothetical protein
MAVACGLSASIHGTAIVAVAAGASRPVSVLVSREEWSLAVTVELMASTEVVAAEQAPSGRAAERARPRGRRVPARAVLAVTAPATTAPTLPVAGERPASAPSVPVAGEPAPQPVPQPTAKSAMRVPPSVARALRVHEFFPVIGALHPGRQPEPVMLEVCVSEGGAVSSVGTGGATDAVGLRLRAAVLTWRYRPLVIDGRPTPFCHWLRVTYEVD